MVRRTQHAGPTQHVLQNRKNLTAYAEEAGVPRQAPASGIGRPCPGGASGLRPPLPERRNLLDMPRRRSQRHHAPAVDPRPVTRVETVPAAQETALKAAMCKAGYAPSTRREDCGLATIVFILSA